MTEEKKSMVPKLRFPEFTATWEQHKLGDLGHTYGGLSGKSKQDFGHGDARFVTYMNVFSNPIGDPCMVDSIEIDDRQSRVRKGDVLFTTSSETPDEVGMSCVWPSDSENLYLNSFCFGYRPTTKINSNFLASLLRSPSVREKIIFLAQGISRYNISKNKVMEISIPLPSEEEQSQIGDFFTQLDKTITLHQRKLEGLSKLKKSLLQKMFPKNGSLGPELRFPGFTGDWEQRKFYDCFKLLRNNSLARAELAKIGKIRNIHYGDVLINYPEVLNISTATVPFIAESRVNSISKDSYLENGDIVIADTAEDESVGKTTEIQGITDHKIVSGLHTIPCRPLVNFSPNFLGFLLNSPSYHDQLKPLIQGIKVSSISKKALGETRVCFAKDLDEQAQIGGFFNGLEMLITLHQRKLESLKKLKKSLLQQMFV